MAGTGAPFKVPEPNYHVTALICANTVNLFAHSVDIVFRLVGTDTDGRQLLLHMFGDVFTRVLDFAEWFST